MLDLLSIVNGAVLLPIALGAALMTLDAITRQPDLER